MNLICHICFFFQVVYVVLSLCVGVLCVLKFGNEDICSRILSQVQGDAAILFGKVCLWLLVLFFTAYAEHHHRKARSRGYLRFYRQMQRVKHLPFTVHSAGGSPECATDAFALNLHKMAVMFNGEFLALLVQETFCCSWLLPRHWHVEWKPAWCSASSCWSSWWCCHVWSITQVEFYVKYTFIR